MGWPLIESTAFDGMLGAVDGRGTLNCPLSYIKRLTVPKEGTDVLLPVGRFLSALLMILGGVTIGQS